MIFINFVSNDDFFCIESKYVIEIVRMVKIKPSESNKISGFLDYRGEIVPVIEVIKYIKNTSKTYQIDSIIAICSFNDKKIAFLTDDIIDTLELDGFCSENNNLSVEFFDKSIKKNDIIYPVLNVGRILSDIE